MEKIRKNWPYFVYGAMVLLYLYFRLLNPIQFSVIDFNYDDEGNYDETITDKVELSVRCSTRWVITYPKEYEGKKVAGIGCFYYGHYFDEYCPYAYKVEINKNVEEVYVYSWRTDKNRLKLIEIPQDIRFVREFDDIISCEELLNIYDDKVKFY